MNQKIAQLLAPRFGLYFLAMIILAAITALLGHVDVAVAEVIVIALMYSVYHATTVRRKKTATDYLNNMLESLDSAARDNTLNCPLPVVMFRPDTDDVIWTNNRFLRLRNDQESLFDTKMSDLCPGFSSRWLLEGKNECPGEVSMDGRRYQVFGTVSHGSGDESGSLATTYWLDVTDFATTRDIFTATRPVIAILLLDNYEDTIKGLEDTVRTAMISQINQHFAQWVGQSNGILCKLDRDRYLFLFEEQYLSHYKTEKFSILDTIRAMESPSGIPVTLSIGIGLDGETPAEQFRFATMSADMALSRGGDQAVVRNRLNFEFYGGRAKETERRTKVKSRVMASALGELVADASCVLVMGHGAADMDAAGAAVGVCALARKKGVPSYIVRENNPTPADELYQRISEIPGYENCFLDSQDALIRADAKTLLVVVDTNRPELVASQEVLYSCNKVAVIDHHRRAASYIEGAALNFHEPSASSASELVTELLSYSLDPKELLRGEAEALLAGIMLDTKNFTMRTGGRTFESAAFLRRAGGDTAEVKKLFQTNLTDTIAKYSIIQNAQAYRDDIAIASVPNDVGRVIAAQAADELLNIEGIYTSFVLYQSEESVYLSARSNNDTNVQIIAEALGGGGNAAGAGARMLATLEEANERLIAALDNYFSSEEETPDEL
jgi:c-di-AMP phosphodiesterase-like protein